jgi:hypothetical protein
MLKIRLLRLCSGMYCSRRPVTELVTGSRCMAGGECVLLYGKATALETFLHIRQISTSQSYQQLLNLTHSREDGVSTFLRNARIIIILHSVRTPKTVI